jgi:hypothetical protein
MTEIQFSIEGEDAITAIALLSSIKYKHICVYLRLIITACTSLE